LLLDRPLAEAERLRKNQLVKRAVRQESGAIGIAIPNHL
jgi:hypothetical protein